MARGSPSLGLPAVLRRSWFRRTGSAGPKTFRSVAGSDTGGVRLTRSGCEGCRDGAFLELGFRELTLRAKSTRLEVETNCADGAKLGSGQIENVGGSNHEK